ncbi:phosphotransferase [Paenibacillus sp. R14(2021)]|uniref:phosphotransferase n=1 Tax=Paenibacillus sp. R14(2021) TaxID=2859228 RepID=UPI0021583FE8|nr:phosphotransferase [Paenibacillus sp. R14(2021)]
MTNSYTKTRIREITRQFGLIPLRSNSIASFYRKNAIIQIQTESGTYGIKPFFRNLLLRSSTIHQIKTTANYIQLLMDSGFSYMPKWLTSNTGKLWTLNQGRPFYITAWIKGRNLENEQDFEALGRALATLHTTSGRFLSTKGSSTRKQIQIWRIQDRLFRRRMAKAIQTNKQNHGWYKKYGKHYKIISDRAWADLRNPEIADLFEKELDRPALIHNDITSPNVIISDDN